GSGRSGLRPGNTAAMDSRSEGRLATPAMIRTPGAGQLQTTLWITRAYLRSRDVLASGVARAGPNADGRPKAPVACERWRGRSVFRHHRDLDRGLDVGVQVHQHVELAGLADRAFAHHHFRLLQRQAGRGEGLGDVARADRAEQLAFGRGVCLDR